MVVHCHPCKRGHRLSLASRRYQNDLFVRIAIHAFDIDHDTRRRIEISELNGGIYYIYHTSAEYGDLSAISFRAVYYLLNTVYI